MVPFLKRKIVSFRGHVRLMEEFQAPVHKENPLYNPTLYHRISSHRAADLQRTMAF